MDWLPVAISLLSLALTGIIAFWQRRHAHRLDAISTAFKADVELYRDVRQAALASHRSTIEKKLAHVQDAIVKTQQLKDAISYLVEAAARPGTFPRVAAISELDAAADGLAEAHGTLTQWFTLIEILPLHSCKGASTMLAAIASSQIQGGDSITHVPDDLVGELERCRILATQAQEQLRLLAQANQFLLGDLSDHAPRLMGG